MSDLAPAERFSELGRMVAYARQLERSCYEIARSLGVRDPELAPVSRALRDALKEIKRGLPPWASTSPGDLTAWINDALEAFELRNRHVHWSHHLHASEDGWRPVRSSLRYGHEEPQVAGELGELAERFQDLAVRWVPLSQGLLFRMRDGVFFAHPDLLRPGTPGVRIYWLGSAWPERPDEDEIRAFYEELVRASPAEWGTWPADRHGLRPEITLRPGLTEREMIDDVTAQLQAAKVPFDSDQVRAFVQEHFWAMRTEKPDPEGSGG